MVLCTVSLYVLGVVRGEGRRNARRFVHSFDGSFGGLSRLCPERGGQVVYGVRSRVL